MRGKEFIEKLKYIHRNPVRRNLVTNGGGLEMEQLPPLPCGRRLWRGDRLLEEQDVQLSYPIIAKRRQLWATRPSCKVAAITLLSLGRISLRPAYSRQMRTYSHYPY